MEELFTYIYFFISFFVGGIVNGIGAFLLQLVSYFPLVLVLIIVGFLFLAISLFRRLFR